jgi:hypothetical protein
MNVFFAMRRRYGILLTIFAHSTAWDVAGRVLSLIFFLLVFFPQAVWAVRPIREYQDLLAGRGEKGYQDGAFTDALFNDPTGMSFDEKNNKLYVADQGNHCIRIVHLDEKNRVETFAGTGEPGNQDGPFSKAAFDKPTLLVRVADGNMVVYDSKSRLLRLLDFKSKTVSTMPVTVKLDQLWSMAYHPGRNALYFSQPELGLLSRLDLSSLQAAVLLGPGDPKVPAPAALCIRSNDLCVADWDLETVYSLPVSAGAEAAAAASLVEIGKGEKINALAVSGDSIYALQTSPPFVVKFQSRDPFELVSIWGEPVQSADPEIPNLFPTPLHERAVLIAGPPGERRFFLTGSSYQEILTFWDNGYGSYKKTETRTKDGLNDLDYPPEKPPNVFRILVLGDSLLYMDTPKDARRWPEVSFNRMELLTKRMELSLNTEAALNDETTSYQVMCAAYKSDENWNPVLWPYHRVPALVEKYKFDLVLLFRPSHDENYWSCFNAPPNEDGVPKQPLDMEYYLKPIEERLPNPQIEEFYRYLVSNKYAFVDPNGKQPGFEKMHVLLENQECVKRLQDVIGKPIGLLGRKIETGRGVAKTRFMVCYVPSGDMIKRYDTNKFRSFWEGLCKKWNVGFLDLTEPFIALRRTYFPVMSYTDAHHFTMNGHQFIAQLMVHELKKKGLLPVK